MKVKTYILAGKHFAIIDSRLYAEVDEKDVKPITATMPATQKGKPGRTRTSIKDFQNMMKQHEGGTDLQTLCKYFGMSTATYYRRRNLIKGRIQNEQRAKLSGVQRLFSCDEGHEFVSTTLIEDNERRCPECRSSTITEVK